MKEKIFVWLIISLIIFIISSCSKDNPVNPEDNVPPGKRDYVWSIDSVDYGNLTSTIQLESIWGSSATDVWGAGYTSDVRDCLWHYNGRIWTRATEGTPITISGTGSRIVGRLWGSEANDVWAIGGRIFSGSQTNEPFVMHYDGNNWTEVTGDINNMPTGCTAIYGVEKNEFWVSESENIVHYKNGVWTKYYVGENLLVWGITGSGGNIYAVAYNVSAGGNRVILLLIRSGQLSIIDETTLIDTFGNYNGKFQPSKLLASNERLYTALQNISSTEILADGGINTSGWYPVITLPQSQFFVNTFFHNSKDFFAAGYPNLLYHYNGADWENIQIIVNNSVAATGTYSAVWGDGNEIFICDTENGIIYHGK